MAGTKRFFISDIHLSSEERYNVPEKSKRARFSPADHQQRLVNFLNKTILQKEAEIKDLVLVGDIFDDWVCPPDEAPPTFDEIFRSNPEIMDALRAIAKSKINLYYLPGNHDFGLKKSAIESEIPALICQKAYDDTSLKLRAEHGNQYVLFNRSYPKIANGRPIGYFITRLSEHLGGYVNRFYDLVSYIDDVLELAAGKSNIFASIIEGLAERAGVNEIVMDAKGKKISIEAVKKMYEPLAAKYSFFAAGKKMAEEGELEPFGDRLSAKKGFKVVIFGHTHKARIDKDSFLVADRIYANSGCWSQKKAHCVIADEDKNGKVVVQLCRVENSGRAVPVETEKV
ncbi:MAG: metallophosphoesterase [Desulfobacterales bacterium]|nr:MAG: metallophosphoesterase [Desulfobacterales bacterium]